MELEDATIGRPDRRLLWSKFRPRGGGSSSLLVGTAHLTWHGSPGNAALGVAGMEGGGPSPRINQSKACAAAMDRLADGGPCLLMGDMNDGFVPRRVLAGAGFVDCFAALGLPARPTYPQRPCTDFGEAFESDQAYDWIFAKGGPRCLVANVFGDLRPPPESGGYASDHMPVAAVYEVET